MHDAVPCPAYESFFWIFPYCGTHQIHERFLSHPLNAQGHRMPSACSHRISLRHAGSQILPLRYTPAEDHAVPVAGWRSKFASRDPHLSGRAVTSFPSAGRSNGLSDTSHRIRPHTRIQHRIDQHLKADLTHSLLSVPQRTGGGQRASGAVSSYRDARSINACFPACLDVFQTGTAIQEGNRKRILV